MVEEEPRFVCVFEFFFGGGFECPAPNFGR